LSEGARAAFRATILFVAVLLAGFIVALIVGFLGGDCGTAGDDAARAACVREHHFTFWTMVSVTAGLGLLASILSWRRRD
jgi:hypothetical protein